MNPCTWNKTISHRHKQAFRASPEICSLGDTRKEMSRLIRNGNGPGALDVGREELMSSVKFTRSVIGEELCDHMEVDISYIAVPVVKFWASLFLATTDVDIGMTSVYPISLCVSMTLDIEIQICTFSVQGLQCKSAEPHPEVKLTARWSEHCTNMSGLPPPPSTVLRSPPVVFSLKFLWEPAGFSWADSPLHSEAVKESG